MIPQDPFLLSGSVRTNIDPNGQFRDEDIEAILKKTYIFDNLLESIGRSAATGSAKDKAARQEKATEHQTMPMISERASLVTTSDSSKTQSVLDYQIKEGGSNISQGQRQLLCIARAIIQKPKILLMDEATANIDSKTDQIIQKIIKTEFRDSTVVTIAHRLNTIIQYDRVVLLNNGEIKDQGSPAEMLERDGLFKDLVMELGDDGFNKMRQFATDHTLDPVLD